PASHPGSTAVPPELSKGLDLIVDDLLDAGVATARTLAREGIRDPFQVTSRPDEPADASQAQAVAASEPESDLLAEVVQGLTLDGTFLQGRDQLAIIGGRVYSRGQHLRVDDSGGASSSPLLVFSVQSSKV